MTAERQPAGVAAAEQRAVAAAAVEDAKFEPTARVKEKDHAVSKASASAAPPRMARQAARTPRTLAFIRGARRSRRSGR